MKYEEQNDNELLFLISESNEDAKSQLIKKYFGIVYSIVKKYKAISEMLRIDEKDLMQEGFIGLSKAIDTYDSTKNVLFYTYVAICIESQIKNALRSGGRKRNISLSTSISLDELSESDVTNINEILKDSSYDPSQQLLDKENFEEIMEKAQSVLAPFEFKVFEYKTKGYSNDEIAQLLNKTRKSIENTFFRIRSKLKNAIKK